MSELEANKESWNYAEKQLAIWWESESSMAWRKIRTVMEDAFKAGYLAGHKAGAERPKEK